jgi:hypothetical protein
VLDRFVGVASEVDRQEALFASASQAAEVARFGMRTGYSACLVPDYCPMDEEEEEAKKDWWARLGIPHTDAIS